MLTNKLYYLIPFLISIEFLQAQNPIVPSGMFIADPEAHVWNDGKLYVYGSRDESNDYWCSYTHHVLGSDNLSDWTVVENAFASKGENDQVKDHDKLLFAPDCAYKNGIYYLYYCSPGTTLTEGVATSNSPLGPFVNGKEIKGAYQIDPAVLIDKDGQGYYLWGQGKAKMAKLKPNMFEIDTTTITYPLDEQGNAAFHEGSSIRRIGDTYYLIFADESRNHKPTCLGYATSKKPMGPYTYRGIIIDNIGSDPKVWNNHGSIQEFKGQWYVFYHRPTNNSQKFRKACIEPISITKDGSINEVEMTTQGALKKPIPAIEVMQAERACFLSGKLFIKTFRNTDVPTEELVNIENNDYASFKFLNFTGKEKQFIAKVSGSGEGRIEIRLDNPEGKRIGTSEIKTLQENVPFKIETCLVETVKGTHALFLVFKVEEEKQFQLDWFKFE